MHVLTRKHPWGTHHPLLLWLTALAAFLLALLWAKPLQ